ncbi:hypothetical protein OsJ_23058 [Oryza sativa Japonica Group]|uniref:Uncharacterized protein n=1 Tax=Oryza sativa subsp. japonica TaxID=39947 RepID=A3BGH6_ORYSJ|nr:hypothetical protein OsJ_23058 [Oryza sativa Japonica Group]
MAIAVAAVLLAGNGNTGHAARHLADTTEAPAAAIPAVPAMPKPTIPTIVPAVTLPPIPAVPKVTLPPMPAIPTVPAVTMPPMPAVPAVPAVTLPPMARGAHRAAEHCRRSRRRRAGVAKGGAAADGRRPQRSNAIPRATTQGLNVARFAMCAR